MGTAHVYLEHQRWKCNGTYDYYCVLFSLLDLDRLVMDDLDFLILLLRLLSSRTCQPPCLIYVVLGQAQGFVHARLYQLSSAQPPVPACFDSFSFLFLEAFKYCCVFRSTPTLTIFLVFFCEGHPLGLLLVGCAESDFSDVLGLKMLPFQPHIFFQRKRLVPFLFLFPFCWKLSY